MTNRYNQYRNKATRAAGSTDMDFIDKQKVRQIMRKYGWVVHDNQFLIIKGEQFKLQSTVLENDLNHGWYLGARPDLTCLKDGHLLIIEIDGKVHKRELDQRYRYTDLKIDHIIINKEYCELEKITWEAWILAKLQELNLGPKLQPEAGFPL